MVPCGTTRNAPLKTFNCIDAIKSDSESFTHSIIGYLLWGLIRRNVVNCKLCVLIPRFLALSLPPHFTLATTLYISVTHKPWKFIINENKTTNEICIIDLAVTETTIKRQGYFINASSNLSWSPWNRSPGKHRSLACLTIIWRFINLDRWNFN